ncbi:Clp protease [Pseudocitrobacter faecalis]|uniref:Clp protease n=2 Tax=Enterobacteriaceae TaxID=543 RepID=A0A5U3R6A4_SALER|nr:Clp protease [Salmonella enterica]EBP6409679.1 Clp protease [Salmonella enterica]EBP7111294.1 Clp protease [Salmonella enterica]
MVRIFMAQSDVSQIKDQYDNEDGKKRIQAIFDNCSTRITLNPGGNRE